MRKHISTFLLAFLVYSGIAANAQDILWMSDYSVLTARFHPTEDYVYTSQEWLGIVKRDKFTGDSLELISDFPAYSMEFSKDGKMLAAGNVNGKLLVLDVDTKNVLFEEQLEKSELTNRLYAIKDVVFSTDGNYVGFACSHLGFRFYETQTFKLVGENHFKVKLNKWGLIELSVENVSFSYDSKYIAIVLHEYDTYRNTVYLYNVITGDYEKLCESDYAKFNPVNDELYVNNSEGIWIYKSLDKKPELLEWQMNRFTVSTDGNDLIRWWAPAGVEVIDIIEQKSIYYKVHTFNGQEMSWQDANFDYSKRYFLLENNKILMHDRGYPLTVNEHIKVKKLEVYPNPTATNIEYSYSLEENAELSIYINDIEGKTVKSIFNKYQISGEYNGSEDISDLAQGTYFLVIESAGSISSNKFVVVK